MKQILRPGTNCTGIHEVKRTGLLVDGHDYYRAFCRAAEGARRYVLLAGWQFDSDVALLRGKDAGGAGETRFLPFLNRLCEATPLLEIYILAWDFAELYLIDREWFQDWVFNWTTNDRVHFRFDDRHAVGASHHEKFVVVDGIVAFVGGMDICAQRWDDRRHLVDNPARRDEKGKQYEPYHDTQSYHEGPAAGELAEIFKTRWENSGGGVLDLPTGEESPAAGIEVTLPIRADEVAISRTRARTIVPPQESVREIRSLYRDALGGAERLIYLENQYFTSEAVYRALVDRLREREGSKLEIVLVLPKEQHNLSEALALGLTQVKMLRSLSDAASSEGHAFGVYYSSARPPERGDAVYIHSKLMIVDDKFLTVGSANTSNRSMGLDTELNVSWEAYTEEHEELVASIRAVRRSLLREHAGLEEGEDAELDKVEGLVRRLDELADSGRRALRRHSMETILDERMVPKNFDPQELMLDPEKPIVEENVYELISHDKTGLFSQGINILSDLLVGRETGGLRRLVTFILRRWWIFLPIALLLAVIAWFALK